MENLINTKGYLLHEIFKNAQKPKFRNALKEIVKLDTNPKQFLDQKETSNDNCTTIYTLWCDVGMNKCPTYTSRQRQGCKRVKKTWSMKYFKSTIRSIMTNANTG